MADVKLKIDRIRYGYDPPLTLTELAERVGVSLSYLSHMLAGRRPATDEVIARVEELTLGRVTKADWVEGGD